MTGLSPEASHTSPADTHTDLWREKIQDTELIQNNRTAELVRHLSVSFADSPHLEIQTYHGKLLIKVERPKTILEVGSGIGGVTAAYRHVLPEVQIISIDRDERAAFAAEKNGVSMFMKGDITAASDEQLSQLLGRDFSEPVNHIVALKTSGEVALFLFDLWQKRSALATLFVSLIEETDTQFVRKMDSLFNAYSGENKTRFFLHEGRDYHEVAWVIDPL